MRTVLLGIIIGLATHSSAFAGELTFKKHVLSTTFYSEGCAAADVNKDGRMDVIAGPFWYEAPEWKPHEISQPGQYKVDGGYSESFINASADVNQDSWPDVLVVGFPGQPSYWYVNPQNKPGHWKRHEISPFTCGESPWFGDLDKDGRLDLVAGFKPMTQNSGWMTWWSPPAKKDNPNWQLHVISKPNAPGTHHFAHGLGVGDLNGDGRNDVLIRQGWWESPADPKQSHWMFHPAALGEDCADMYAYDVDADGDKDVISSSAHKYGIWWHEQRTSDDGKTTWVTHTIYDKFSQTHALHLADMNGDGLPDLVTGKRFYAHNGKDPGGKEPAVLFWFEFARVDGKVNWTPHQIDDDSGVGTQFVVQDINEDDRLDIVTSNKKGTFVFENRSR